jgi:hypothetical protein
MRTILIGIDDTDNMSSPGTGSLARRVAALCQQRGMQLQGVTRHQFLLDAEIPYTSHNSGACVSIRTDQDITAVFFVFEFVSKTSASGSDPGVCVVEKESVSQAVMNFGNAASYEVLETEYAFSLAKQESILLCGLGGTCQGVIGALASVGQCARGDNGRFIDLPGLRRLSGRVSRQCYDKIGITVEYEIHEKRPDPNDDYETLDWVRPRLSCGKPVLNVEWSSEKNAWIPTDRKKSRPLE